eukprot:10975743-Alexandrium_andersonii.AAC.1
MSHVVESLSSEQPSVTGARPDSLEEAQLRQLGIRAPPSFAGSVVALGSGSNPFGGGLQALRSSEPAPLLSDEQRQAAIAQAAVRRNANVGTR